MISNFYEPEQLIIDSLTKYVCLTKAQLVKLINQKDRDTALRIITGLQKKQYIIVDPDSNKVRIDPRGEYSYKMEMAYWILLKFIDKIKNSEHYDTQYPSDIYFLKDGQQYEIIVIESPSEEYLLNILAKRHETADNSDEDYDDEIRYIIGIPNEEMIPSCNAKLKGIKKLYAVYKFGPTDEEPTFKFVQPED